MQKRKSEIQLPPKALHEFFSRPSLMSGEDAETYAELYAEVDAQVKPRNVFDRMRVSDIVNRLWEQQRFRRATGAVINGNRREALVTILSVGIGLRPRDARAAADVYFGLTRLDSGIHLTQSELGTVKLPGNRAALVGLLGRHGFSEADIDHIATQMSVDTLAGLEDLALKHETRREAIFAALMRDRERLRRDEQPAAQEDERGGRRAASHANAASDRASSGAALQ
jgi:hypothetical protein